MKLNRLKLYDWRNYEALDCEFSPGVNLLLGENAQGKTNLLEALYYLSNGQSFRTRTAGELIRFGAEFAELQAEFSVEDREQTLRCILFQGRRPKQLYVGGVKKKSCELFPTVLFCPEDLLILKGSGQGRRKWLDRALSQLRPTYRGVLLQYQKCLEQKSVILREQNMLEILPEYNESLCRLGAVLISYRSRYLRALEEAAQAYQWELSGSQELLTLTYRTVTEDVLAQKEQLYCYLREHLERHAKAELESRQCLTGPHRDDFEAALHGLSIRSFGSQGQTRTAAIALKLAERELLRRQLQEEPILLLDDVLSELDAKRQDYVLNKLKSGQVFITCCETDRLTDLGKTFTVQEGHIVEEASCIYP